MAPVDSIWRKSVAETPLHSRSSAYVSNIGRSSRLKADFGAGTWEGRPIGIPISPYRTGTPAARINFEVPEESETGPYPIPRGAKIEGGENAPEDTDRHVIVFDKNSCRSYELYNAFRQADGSWRAYSGAIFDLKSNKLRPDGWTSADAAGLPILPGLVRYEEVEKGAIKHALRMTVPRTVNNYVWPARHYASHRTDSSLPPMGLRLRLKKDVDITGLPPQARVIAKALQTYGAMVADGGSPWYISGTEDSRWDNDQLATLGRFSGNDFEAVDMSGSMISRNSGKAN